MNKFIKSQLDKIAKQGIIYEIDKNTCSIKSNSRNPSLISEFNEGDCFLISLADYILFPPENFTLHDNWNKGIKPVDKYMNIEIEKVQGKMIKVNGVGYDYVNSQPLNTMWSGWLPQKSITIIRSL